MRRPGRAARAYRPGLRQPGPRTTRGGRPGPGLRPVSPATRPALSVRPRGPTPARRGPTPARLGPLVRPEVDMHRPRAGPGRAGEHQAAARVQESAESALSGGQKLAD
jgi:hypothetical protein